MDLDTRCISLEYMQSYFDLRKTLVMEPSWLERRFLHPTPQFLLSALSGLDEEGFYRRAGIPQDRGPGYLISTRQCLSLVEQAIEGLDVPYLGLAIGKLMTISHYGTMGVSAITRTTFGECLDAIADFNRGLFPPLDMPGFVRGKNGVFAIRDNLPLGPYRRFFHELVMISFTNIFLHLLGVCSLTGSVSVTRSPPGVTCTGAISDARCCLISQRPALWVMLNWRVMRSPWLTGCQP